MELKYGFRFLEERMIEEVKGKGSLWLHEKSGARLFHIACEDDNKVFSVSFRTPPADDTGLPHILEHSVLCGSRKFPLREPFVELVKGSLNTFLNAMTFPDKTMYPVASRNNQDFKNLVDVYLDAVFFPNIHGNPWTLKQEGWHYELENLEGELTYNGVVYNEMKGVFSSPDAVLEQKIFSSLFPDTPYGKESGGDPEAIPQLTQADFEEFHRTYYHPSNSFFYLYGDMNLDDYLAFFDQEYLNSFDKIEVNSAIPMQKSFAAPLEEVVEYSLPQEESVEEKAILTLNWAIDTKQDLTLTMGLDLLCHILLETSASPLKKALQEAGIAKEISGDFQDSLLQPVFSITATFGEEDRKEKFQKVIFETLEKIAKEGISPKLIAASLHRQEFSLREGVTGTTPKGLIYGIRAMNSWLYDGHPADSLIYEEPLRFLKEGSTKGYFERLIENYLLNNNHRSLVIAKPVLGLTEGKEKEVADQLAQWKKGQSKETLEQIIRETEELNRRQTAPDSEESLNTIPLLKRSDLEEKPDFPNWQEKKLDNGMVELSQQLFTSRILYSSLSFDGMVIPQSEVAYLHLLGTLLGRMDTENYTYEELSNEVNLRSGGMSFSLYGWNDKDDAKAFYPRFMMKTKALTEDVRPLFQLVLEIIQRSQFTNEKRLKELIAESRARMENSMNDAGQQIAVGRLSAALSNQGAYNFIGQLPFYQFVRQLDENFEQEKQNLMLKLAEVCNKIFASSGLVINLAGDKEELAAWEEMSQEFLHSLSREKHEFCSYEFPVLPDTEGIYGSGKVQYVAQGFNFKALGKEFSGVYKVVETILRYDYLWNRIRVQGGAYGAAARFERSGNVIFNSYRDPNLKETLEVYQGLADYLRSFNPGEREMTKYVIGTMSGLDTPLTPSLKAELALSAYFSGVTVADVQKERLQVLKIEPETIQEMAEWIEKGIQENRYCVFGGEDKIKKQKELFERVISATSCD